MSHKLNSSKCSLIDESSETSVLAKLRRLKIEENLLIKNINKMNLQESDEDNSKLPVIYSLESKNCTTKLKNCVSEINNMFGDLKAMTEEKLSSADIDNMKRDVVILDDKIRHIKSYLQSELALEVSRERELTKQMNDIEEKQSKYSFKPKIKIKPFSQIVPSPVKILIKSPFKCKEVQNFQEFMMISPNRYGGWNEYHHNVFVQVWQKHFKCNEELVLNEAQELSVLKLEQFHDFQREILEKVMGFTYDDIILHCKWYCKYLYLKEKQQNALNKWKRNREILTKSSSKQGGSDNHHVQSANVKGLKPNCNQIKVLTNLENGDELLDSTETRDADEIANALCDVMTLQEDLSLDTEIVSSGEDKAAEDLKQRKRSFSDRDVLKPTKQWISRCSSSQEARKGYCDLESIKKLRTPDWRLALQDW